MPKFPNDSPAGTPKKCKGCNSTIVNVIPVPCKICSVNFHPGCAKNTTVLPSGGFQKCCGVKKALSLQDIREMFRTENSSLRTVINEDYQKVIDPLQKSITELKEDVAKFTTGFEERLIALETGQEKFTTDLETARLDINKNAETIATIQCKVNNNKNQMERDVLEEVEDRINRSTNVIIFGLQESKEEGIEARQQFDTKQVEDVFRAVELNIAHSEHHRLGKYSPALKIPRPIKIRLRHAYETDMIIQSLVEHKRKNSLPQQLTKLAVSKDRTLRQRAAQKDACLKIVMKRGMPSIVKGQQYRQNVAE